jgi:hypothetical protein
MRMGIRTGVVVMLLCGGVVSGVVDARAQGRAPEIPSSDVRRSQQASVWQRVANTDITVTYSRPVARGRELFGALVRYGRVWHPGADQATAVTFSSDVTVNGRALPAGKYSLWMIPTEGTWTVIFSHAGDVFHTPYPGEARDAMRLTVTPEVTPHTEVLTWDFPMVEGKDTVLRLRWGTVSVPMAVVVP